MPLTRDAHNPVLRPSDIPPVRADLADVTSVFNPGACLWRGRELLVLRVQNRGRETVLMPGERMPDGAIHVTPRVIEIEGLDAIPDKIYHLYDPRLTVIDDTIYAVLAADIEDECRLVIARSHDFNRWAMVSFDARGDRRNGVLFPEKIGGRFARLERPNTMLGGIDPSSGSTITLATSDDLVTWREAGGVMTGRPKRWDELIGAGPPPVKTREGWLLIYHGVARHFASSNIYQAGVCLLDLCDPTRVIRRGRLNILEPRELYELIGQVPNVVFPSGMVVESFDAEGFTLPTSPVRVYYGAADTVIGAATSTIEQLISDCCDEGTPD
ncbi:MAG: glycoside hydrolase family 130 protein, partial [Phycisphaerales bacterium]|nr:glycoside hydrolase family 130 protein [Phycisphaerales bacterium]